MRKAEKKPRDPLNEDNRWWKKKLSILDNKEALETMFRIGCPSRGIYLNMAIKKFTADLAVNKKENV